MTQNAAWLEFGGDLQPFDKGEYLFTQGKPVENMYYLESGRATLLRHTREGDSVLMHVATAGELVAEASLFSEHYHCSARIEQPSLIYRIERGQLMQKLSAQPELYRQLLKLLSQQIRDLRSLIEIRNIRSAEERILAYLRSIADAGGGVELEIPLREVAYKLGLAHETLYRCLKKLEGRGLLSRSNPGELIVKI